MKGNPWEGVEESNCAWAARAQPNEKPTVNSSAFSRRNARLDPVQIPCRLINWETPRLGLAPAWKTF